MELQSVWGWQPALYLFLGGMGAGAFIMAAILYLKDRERNARIVCASMWAAAISLIVGLLLLLMELVTPLRGLMMWQSFSHFTSWMTYGAWGAFGAIAVFGVSAVLATPKVGVWLTGKCSWYIQHEQGVRKVLAVAGIVLGAFVAFYTGMLLMTAGSVPFWNTLLLPALFTVSAFDTGVALVELVAVALAKKEAIEPGAKRFMEKCVVVLVVLEAVVLAAFLGSMLLADASTPVGAAAAASAGMFVSGQLAVWFWGLVAVLGLALPFAMAVKGLLAKEEPAGSDAKAAAADVKPAVDVPTLVGAAGALVGGCALRFLVLAAGIHADVVADTIMKMIG
ncbi:NrfD/PsrC family molybdoenzyme membrane anchor subunit [Slackia piriformis]|uniref:NrfD/PsrC family molybdoenzyme membrane anchor subunit n=1 Tax=Slackia piriformis TaxID=626934 RepID=UPI0039F4B802